MDAMKRSAPLKRTPLNRGAGQLHRTRLATVTPIRAVSRKRGRQNRTYRELRREYLAVHTVCEFPLGCGQPSTEVHHRKGRIGDLLLDVAHWSALCHGCHVWVTEHPAEAVRIGASELRLSEAS